MKDATGACYGTLQWLKTIEKELFCCKSFSRVSQNQNQFLLNVHFHTLYYFMLLYIFPRYQTNVIRFIVNQETEPYRNSVIDIPAKLFTNTRCKSVTSLYFI